MQIAMDWKSSGECAQLTDADAVTLYGKQRGDELHGCSRNSRKERIWGCRYVLKAGSLLPIVAGSPAARCTCPVPASVRRVCNSRVYTCYLKCQHQFASTFDFKKIK